MIKSILNFFGIIIAIFAVMILFSYLYSAVMPDGKARIEESKILLRQKLKVILSSTINLT